jgi:hypothetical protein
MVLVKKVIKPELQANSLYGALATNGFPVANVHGGSANTTL